MFIRPLGATAALVLLATGCGTSGTTAQEPITSAGEAASPSSETSREEAAWVEPEPYVPPAPLEWTGAFSETAVLLADSIRIEGPAPLIEHVAASSDKELYERSVTTTSRGLVQKVKRRPSSSREVRVNLDAWSIAAMNEVVIVETAAQGPVRVIAAGNVTWRDLDAHLIQGEQLQFAGAIGDDSPYTPPPGGGER